MNIVTEHRDNKELREEYFSFISKVFPSADFREWSARGFWSDKYKAYSLIENGKIISNVGVSDIDLIINGEKKKGLQFGAVGTLNEHRNKGYSRYLLEYILSEYDSEEYLIFLFANSSVLEFYPKFGFIPHKQYIFKCLINKPADKNLQFRKLNIEESTDLLLLMKMLESRYPVTGIFGAENYEFIAVWHILNFYRNKLFYNEKYNAILVADRRDDSLHILEIIAEQPFDISPLIRSISENVKEIRLYFPPDKFNFAYDEKIIFSDSPLFILGEHDFKNEIQKFPELAIT
jgi:predicted N-acetyltransferase YhbS